MWCPSWEREHTVHSAVAYSGSMQHCAWCRILPRKLQGAQYRYDARNVEALAAQVALAAWRPLLYGVKFELLSDHSSLTHLFTQKAPSQRILRMCEFFADYDFEVIRLCVGRMRRCLFPCPSTGIRRHGLTKGRVRKRGECSNRLASTPPCPQSHALWLCLHTAHPHRARCTMPLTTPSFLLPNPTTHKAACGPARAPFLHLLLFCGGFIGLAHHVPDGAQVGPGLWVAELQWTGGENCPAKARP